MTLAHRSQSALEYMMTYGWAILVIVIVAGVLYSLGIFSPSSSLSTTITGFSGLAVTQAGCVNSVNNQILELYVTNAVGYPVNITKINTTGNNGIDASQNVSSILGDGASAVFYVNGACNKSSSYAGSATITYTEPGQVFPGPYFSTGKVANVLVSSNSNLVASFNGANSYIIASPYSGLIGNNKITIVAWIKQNSGGNLWTGGGGVVAVSSLSEDCTGTHANLMSQNPGSSPQNIWFWGGCDDYQAGLGPASVGVWEMIGLVYTGSPSVSVFLNKTIDSGTLNGGEALSIPSNAEVQIGEAHSSYTAAFYNGSIANVQIYNAVLSAQQIDLLYSEGMGGAPLPNAGLVAWWPLDGNANDYSGNNNNGVAYNVQWVSP